jgi:PAS domain-containing protein
MTRNITICRGTLGDRGGAEDGWDAAPENQQTLRLIILAAACLTIVPVFFATCCSASATRISEQLEKREETLLELSQRLDLALESSNIGIWELRTEGQPVLGRARRRAARPAGCRRQLRARRLAGHHRYSEDRRVAKIHLLNEGRSGSAYTTQYRVELADGSIRHLRSVGSVYSDAAGTSKTIGIVWDVTPMPLAAETLRQAKDMSDIKNAELELALDELSHREAELAELSGKLDLALDSYQCGIWEADARRRRRLLLG